MPSQQSAYRQRHSIETVVLKVYMAGDSGLVSALCLLDLTAAFDTVHHDLLLLRLERQFGLCGVTLLWFRSYLSGRSYRVWFAGRCLEDRVCRLLGSSGLSPRPAAAYHVLCGPGRQGCRA